MQKILVIEDDEALAEGICLTLQQTDFTIESFGTLAAAKKKLQADTPDLILLDINLPDGNGLDFCRALRQTSNVPLILLTARNLETDVITGFGVGADDYVTKPFSLAILRAKVAALLKRVGDFRTRTYHFSEAIFDFDRQKFLICGKEVELSKREQQLLEKLFVNPGITLTRENLLEELWSVDGDFVDQNALSVVVKRLREKLRDAEDSLCIRTVYGIGYRLEVKSL